MYDLLNQPWPWWVAGPLIGLLVPLLAAMGRRFGVSSSLRHVCAATVPKTSAYFSYDLRPHVWNWAFVVGIGVGGTIAAIALPGPGEVTVSDSTRAALADLGIAETSGLAPTRIFAWNELPSGSGLMIMVIGGFLVGFGARWAGGCTSGQAISGLAELRLSSLVVVVGFFAGGLLSAHILLPLLLGSGR